EFAHPGGTEAVADLLDEPHVLEADGLVHGTLRSRLVSCAHDLRFPTGLAFFLDPFAFVDGDDLGGHLDAEVDPDVVLNLGRHGLVAEFCQGTPHGFGLVGQFLYRLAVASSSLASRSARLFCLRHVCCPLAENYSSRPTMMMPDRPTNMQAVLVAGDEKRIVFVRIISTIVLSSGFIALHPSCKLKTATEVRAGGREEGMDGQVL